MRACSRSLAPLPSLSAPLPELTQWCAEPPSRGPISSAAITKEQRKAFGGIKVEKVDAIMTMTDLVSVPLCSLSSSSAHALPLPFHSLPSPAVW